ncbi:MAG: CCA tRNA nucleotidyltransferase [Agathobacter sp.]
MKISLPKQVNRIIHTLQAEGYDAYAVGGCVRDCLLGRTPKDWDITTSARPEAVKALFSHTIDTGIQHGTVTVMLDHVGYEVTTYRIDGEYEDARHPKEVVFTGNLLEDLRRRDFTINAMAYNEDAGLVDAFEGAKDLKKGVIRCVGRPHDRFGEDALRMLRALRFSAQLGFSIDGATRQAIADLAQNLARVSAERIQMELLKLLTSDNPQVMRDVYELGLTRVFLPEFDRMMETGQNNKHHCYTVGEHTIVAMQNIQPRKVLRLAVLLHDVAKPVCITTDEAGQNHFKGHPEEGARMARKILRRLKFDNDTTDRVCLLIRWHDDRPKLSQRNVRRVISRVGTDSMEDLFAVKRADTLGQSLYQRREKLDYVDKFERLYHEVLEKNQCVTKKDLAVNGRDLIALGMEPGPRLGEVLDALFERVLDTPELNTREQLLAMAQQDRKEQTKNK